MCTFWGYHCSTCGNSSPHWFGDGQELLMEMHDQAAGRANAAGLGLLWRTVMAYLAKHRGHQVCLESEFGERVALPAEVTRNAPEPCLVKVDRWLKRRAESSWRGIRPRLDSRWKSGEVLIST